MNRDDTEERVIQMSLDGSGYLLVLTDEGRIYRFYRDAVGKLDWDPLDLPPGCDPDSR